MFIRNLLRWSCDPYLIGKEVLCLFPAENFCVKDAKVMYILSYSFDLNSVCHCHTPSNQLWLGAEPLNESSLGEEKV